MTVASRFSLNVADVVDCLVLTRLRTDDVAISCCVLGGGNVKKIKTLPAKTRLGTNGNAFVGGYRLWSEKQGTGTNAFAA